MNNLVITRKSLTNILLLQWSRFGAVPIKVNASTLFTGINGSGKSTILDALTYLLTGNTQFNQAAKDKDRTVLSYVRGDTKSNGEFQYLRKGSVISYIVCEFFSPAENFFITIGVCIESADEQNYSPTWFICEDSRISDFNFYYKNGPALSVTPKYELKCKNVRLKTDAFNKKENGITKLQRRLGLRFNSKQKSDEFRRKLLKMMSFQPENNIDKFIRDSVLAEKKITTLDHIREQKQQFAQIKETYNNILKLQQLLNEIEKKSIDYEKAERNLNLKTAQLYYQYYILENHKLTCSKAELELSQEESKRLTTKVQIAEEAFKKTQERKNEYDSLYKQNDLATGISELEKQIADDERSIKKAQDEVTSIIDLQANIKDLVEELEITLEEKNTLKNLDSIKFNSTEKYTALKRFENIINDEKNSISEQIWQTENELSNISNKTTEISQSVKKLENNIIDYPPYVALAKNEINEELKKRNITAEVRTFAELIKSINLPQWRDVIEVYLRNNKFNLIIESTYVSDALDIFCDKKYRNISLVLTDKFENYTANPNSAATILNIPNKEAQLYANYLLGRLHLCESIKELHNHPKGGIMTDGTLATSFTVKNMSLDKVDYYIGQDAIKLQLDNKKRELESLVKKHKKLDDDRKNLEERRAVLVKLNLSCNNYNFDVVNLLPVLLEKNRSNKITLDEMKNNPNLLILIEQCDRANKEYTVADECRLKINSEVTSCNAEISRLSESIYNLINSTTQKKTEFDKFILMHLELKKEAISEYQRLSKSRPDGIVISKKTISNYESELKKCLTTLEDSQIKYCNLSGRNSEERGSAYIKVYREERNRIVTVDAEETKNKLSEKQKKLESAFITDFIASLCESLNNAKSEINAINKELSNLPFGQDTYSFKVEERKDKAAFFRIKNKIYDDLFKLNPSFLEKITDDIELKQDIEDFLDTILRESDDDEYSDYRTYYKYDMKITNKVESTQIVTDLSVKQGSASNGEKQTPYFIILAASLMQCYPKNTSCIRLAFIDEAFAALSQERIEQMVKYFEQNGFQVIYAAPPEKINSIGKHINSTVSLIETGRYTNVVEGLASDFI